jgi:hypothetical protein
MSDELLPAKVRLTDGLGPLPEPVAWFRAPYGTLEPNPLFRVTGPQSLEWAVACFTETQLRAAVAAERERIARVFDARDKGAGGFYDPHEPAEIIRALGPDCEDRAP